MNKTDTKSSVLLEHHLKVLKLLTMSDRFGVSIVPVDQAD